MPRQSYRNESIANGEVFVGFPTDSMDFGDAFNVAKDLFMAMYENEDFLIREETEESNMDEE